MYALDDMRFATRIGPRIASGIYFATEYLLSILCIEIKYRCKIINSRVKHTSLASSIKIVRFVRAFEVLSNAQNVLNNNFQLFVLLNLSQLFLLVVFGCLGILVPCVAGLTSPFGGINNVSRCFSFTVVLVDGIIRFVLLIWVCSSISVEVSTSHLCTYFLINSFFCDLW
jgi:hypothetical protein